ncbi:DUF6407 family protein [Bacillus sp. AK128]
MNFEEFISQYSKKFKNIDPSNLDLIKELVNLAIDSFKLKSFVEVEVVNNQENSFLYVHSMAEENSLSKIVQLAIGDGSDLSIEEVFRGQIIRQY